MKMIHRGMHIAKIWLSVALIGAACACRPYQGDVLPREFDTRNRLITIGTLCRRLAESKDTAAWTADTSLGDILAVAAGKGYREELASVKQDVTNDAWGKALRVKVLISNDGSRTVICESAGPDERFDTKWDNICMRVVLDGHVQDELCVSCQRLKWRCE